MFLRCVTFLDLAYHSLSFLSTKWIKSSNSDITSYLYDEANRLVSVDGVDYTWDANGNLLATDTSAHSWDAANRLVETSRDASTLEPIYNGIGDRVGQTVGGNTTYFALDVLGLPEVIQTSEGNAYLHLPGVIVAESAGGEVRYLLSDGLGSIRQAVDENAAVVASYEFDPYGNPVDNEGGEPYGFTGEWWDSYIKLLHFRARWYLPETGTFLSQDPWDGNISRPDTLHGYSYATNNPILYKDSSGLDYIPWLDRYTCDDPRAASGYVYQYDRATETWGLWPCIVNPDNVTRQGPPSWPTFPSTTGSPSSTRRQDGGFRFPEETLSPVSDPLTSEQWKLSKQKANLFQVPVELVAGTVAVEIVHDTDWSDPVKDWINRVLLAQYYAANPCAASILGILEEYEGRGPGPGVTNFHTGTAKNVENYYQTYYSSDKLLVPLEDNNLRQLLLLDDTFNIHYAAAYLRMLADIRKGRGQSYALHSHLSDLTDVDMQIIYGAFRAGVSAYGRPTPNEYQQAKIPGKFGNQIRPWLFFYREKARKN